MPKEKDIAWKFVIKLKGNKWRCPYCENEYTGQVTRVKSHLLKSSNKGIAPCKKVPEHISTLMGCLHNQTCNKDEIAWEFVNRLGDNKWHCHYCSEEFFGDLTKVNAHLLEVPNEGISICTKVPDHDRELMRSLLDEVAEEESREANGQSSMEPQSCDLPTQAEVHEEESREANGQSSMEPQSRDLPTQAEVAAEESRKANGQPSVEPQSRDLPTQAEVAEEESREANPQFATGTPSHLSTRELDEWIEQLTVNQQDAIGLNSDQQSQADRRLHQSSTVSLSVQNSHALVPLQHQSVPPQSVNHNIRNAQHNTRQPNLLDHRLGAAHGNEIASSSQPFFMGLPALSSLYPSELPLLDQPTHLETGNEPQNSRGLSQVPEASTNAIGPSSSQDMNRVSPIMNVRSIYYNNEEIKNLKRKVEELDYKEAVIKEQVEIETAASSVRKKPRIVVQKWLKETERARNNFQMIGQANAEILPPTEQVETLTREVEVLIEQTLPQTLLIKARDAKGDAFLVRKLIGKEIHRNIELILKRLKENHVCKLGIYGMGGVGKTTIMMHVHNRLLKDASFDGVLFVTVSQDFSIYKLQSDIWKALQCGVMKDEHEKKRAAMLWECLEEKKKCVLILDDVWRHFKLQDVGIPDKPGLKVVLTTRLSEVCSRMDCEEIKIQPLGEEEAWKLFVEELGPQTLKNMQFVKVARKITNSCAGLPLAINAMARSMRGEKNVFVWQDTLNKLERSHTKHTEMGDEVLPVLTLSYERLSDPQVKQCFVFCALFPEDESIETKELIEYFIDEGFLDELDTREEQYCRGLATVDKLRNACLLEVDYHGHVRMHDLMRDMALHIMNMTYMVQAGQVLRTILNEDSWTEDLEKVSLMWGWIEDIPPDVSPNCPKLSTLLLNHCIQQGLELPDSFFMNLPGLKALNLSGCAITELPNSLSELANLRALLLRHCGSLIRIPYLGKLKCLRKLDAYGCESLLEVEGLEELSNLKYLDLSETGIERSWEGTFSRMVNLQYLRIAGKVKAEEVIRLKALNRLECSFGKVDDFNEYVRFMERSRHNNHSYELIVDQDKSLWFVTESVYSDPEILPENKIEFEWDYDAYSNYGRAVKIRSCNYAIARVGEERDNDSILIPGDVEVFRGGNWRGMTNLSGMSRLQCLKMLVIKKWDNLVEELFGGARADAEEIDNTQDSSAPLFPSLEELVIERCSKLKRLFGHESRFSLPLLREVFIYECEGIEGLTTSVASPPQPGVGECGNMKRVVGSEWLPHFPNLMAITVRDCNNIRELLPHECLLHLPNLACIIVRGCEGMEEIITRGGENQGGSAPLNIYVSNCPKLKTIP